MPEKLKAALAAVRPRLGRLFNSQDPTLEANLAGYVVGVLTISACCIVWTVKGNRDAALVGALGVLAGLVAGGLFKKGSNAPSTETTGAKDKEGGAV